MDERWTHPSAGVVGTSDMASDSRKLIAVVHADVVGYSRLIGLDDTGTLARLKTLRRELIDPAVIGHGGTMVSAAGDSFLMTFDSIHGAVRCAVAVQQHVPDYDGDSPPDRIVRLRIGINVGDAIADGMDVHGDSVNVAVRLQAQCPLGEICVSRAVRDHVGDRFGLRIEELGLISLKNIARPVEAFVLRLDRLDAAPDRAPGIVGFAPVARPDKPSLAVLPFTNMSADPDQTYFSDGIAEDIITELSRSRSLLVIARNSSFTYQGRSVDIRQIARELGVRYVHEGSVRRSGDLVRVTAQLIDAETGSHLWAERYDRTLADIFDVQDEITSSIVCAIQPEIALAEQQRAMRKPPHGLGAWDAYQRGLWHRSRIDSTENQTAREYFHRAIEADSTFAPPYHALAQTYFDDALLYFTRTFAAAADLAEPSANKALTLDPNDADAYSVMALVAAARGDLGTELAMAEQAISRNPNCATAYRIKGGCEISYPASRAQGCQTHLRALRLNPHDPRNCWSWNSLAMGRYLLEDYQGAVDAATQAFRVGPRSIPAYRWLIAALGRLGRTDEAQDFIRQAGAAVAPVPFDDYAQRRFPWLREEDRRDMLHGLHMAGWHPAPARID